MIPEHDCYAKFTSCSTQRNVKATLWKTNYQKTIKQLIWGQKTCNFQPGAGGQRLGRVLIVLLVIYCCSIKKEDSRWVGVLTFRVASSADMGTFFLQCCFKTVFFILTNYRALLLVFFNLFNNKEIIFCIFYQVNLTGSGLFK